MRKGSTLNRAIMGAFALMVFAGATVLANITLVYNPNDVKLYPDAKKLSTKSGMHMQIINASIIAQDANAITIAGVTKLRSTNTFRGFHGGLIATLRSADGNGWGMYSINNNKFYTDSADLRGGDYGWGVNARKSRTVSWQTTINLTDPALLGKGKDITEIDITALHTPNTALQTFTNIVENIKKFLDTKEGKAAQLAAKYAIEISQFAKDAKAASEAGQPFDYARLITIMKNMAADAASDNYKNLITSAQSTNINNILDALKVIIDNHKGGFTPANHDQIIAIVNEIAFAITTKDASTTTVYKILEDLHDLLSDKSGFAFDNLKQIGIIVNNTRELVQLEKKNPKANNVVKQIADLFENLSTTEGSVFNQQKLDCIFNSVLFVVTYINNPPKTKEAVAAMFENLKLRVTDLEYCGFIPEGKAQYVNNIIESINILVANNGWKGLTGENVWNIASDVYEIINLAKAGTIDKAKACEIVKDVLDNVKTILSDKGNLVPQDLQQVEVILIDIDHLADGKLMADPDSFYSKLVANLHYVNTEWDGSVASQELLDTIFNNINAIVDYIAGGKGIVETLTAMVNGVDEQYLSAAQKESFIKIINAVNTMVVESGDWEFSSDVQAVALVNNIIKAFKAKQLSYDNLAAIVGNVEHILTNLPKLAPENVKQVQVVLEEMQSLLKPLLEKNPQVDKAFGTVVTAVQTINNLPDISQGKATILVISTLDCALECVREITQDGLSVEEAHAFFNTWYEQNAGLITEVLGEKADTIKTGIVDNLFTVVSNGKEGWDTADMIQLIGPLTVFATTVSAGADLKLAAELLLTNIKALVDAHVIQSASAAPVMGIIETIQALVGSDQATQNAIKPIIESIETDLGVQQAA